MQLKVMSFNTQHCRNFLTGIIDFDCMADTISRFSPDVVGLNEMRMEGEHPEYTDQVPMLAQLAGYPYWYFAKALDVSGKNPYGNGILSKYPILFAETIPVPDPVVKDEGRHYETRCLLHAKIDIPGGLDVFVIHFGLNPSEQKNAVETVIANLTDSHCILMGDFNVTPDDPVLMPIRQKLFDTAELFQEPLLSYPSDKPKIKIDYIFASSDLIVHSAGIPAIVASDHRPHIAEIGL